MAKKEKPAEKPEAVEKKESPVKIRTGID